MSHTLGHVFGHRLGHRYGTNGLFSTGVADVVWTNVVNATATGNTLVKTGGALAWDAGGTSTGTISGDGYIEFEIAAVSQANVVAGLSVGNTDEGMADIDFGMFINTSVPRVEVWEGVSQKHIGPSVSATDKFRVKREGTTITYWHDTGSGFVLLYTSLASSTGDLLLDCSLAFVNPTYTPGSQIVNAVIFGA